MDSPPSGSNTVHRAMAVLIALRDAPPEGLGISDLTRRVGANRSTIYRIIDALKAYGFVRAGVSPGIVRLGFGIVELADAAIGRLDVREVAAPHLRDLSNQTGETCHLAVLDEVEVVYIDKAESDQAMRLSSRPGKRQPLHCTALGKAFLAAMAPNELEKTLGQLVLERRTERTIDTREKLIDELRLVARRGWATDIGENAEGVNCVGAAIYGRDDTPLAAISASAPVHRFTRGNISDYGRIVLATAQAISRDLGRTESITSAPRPLTVAVGQ